MPRASAVHLERLELRDRSDLLDLMVSLATQVPLEVQEYRVSLE